MRALSRSSTGRPLRLMDAYCRHCRGGYSRALWLPVALRSHMLLIGRASTTSGQDTHVSFTVRTWTVGTPSYSTSGWIGRCMPASTATHNRVKRCSHHDASQATPTVVHNDLASTLKTRRRNAHQRIPAVAVVVSCPGHVCPTHVSWPGHKPRNSIRTVRGGRPGGRVSSALRPGVESTRHVSQLPQTRPRLQHPTCPPRHWSWGHGGARETEVYPLVGEVWVLALVPLQPGCDWCAMFTS